jgi:hypothetical protein
METPLPMWREVLSRCLLWLLGILGPLFALRIGLKWLQNAKGAACRWPMASPVLQIAAGVAGVWVAAIFCGLLTRGLLDPAAGLWMPRRWRWCVEAGPLILASLSLYREELAGLTKKASSPATYKGILQTLGFLAFVVFILLSRRIFSVMERGLAPSLSASGAGILWWLVLRWREILVGFPCLAAAFFAYNSRLDCPDCEIRKLGPLGDARPWILAGLLAPSGVLGALGSAGLPLDLALRQCAASAAVGTVLGALGLAAGLYLKKRRMGGIPESPDIVR